MTPNTRDVVGIDVPDMLTRIKLASKYWPNNDLMPLLYDCHTEIEKGRTSLDAAIRERDEAIKYRDDEFQLRDALATENAPLRNALADLLRQVESFVAEQGEADFYTGNALAALGWSDNPVHRQTLADLMCCAPQPPVAPGSDGPDRIGGWAKGNYECRCSNCHRSFVGDKRSLNCRECAESFTGADPQTSAQPTKES